MKGLYAVLFATLMLTGLAGQAVAQTDPVDILYSLEPLGGNQYEYDYTVYNNTLNNTTMANGKMYEGVLWFNVYFPVITNAAGQYVGSNYSNLQAVGPMPAGWQIGTGGINQPGTPSFSGYFGIYGPTGDANGSYAPIGPGQSLGVFYVTFTYSGSGTPGSQAFQVIDLSATDPVTHFPEVLYPGTTEPDPVPLPPSVYMLGASLVALAFVRKKR
ncbi:MAG TPA: hypothetical protein VKF36_13035 [Syntrophorhabdales bacterium]|nr:hypothetical protein [Syntrophorhabdales bacterium]